MKHMTTKKKLLSLLICLMTAFVLCACSGEKTDASAKKKEAKEQEKEEQEEEKEDKEDKTAEQETEEKDTEETAADPKEEKEAKEAASPEYDTSLYEAFLAGEETAEYYSAGTKEGSSYVLFSQSLQDGEYTLSEIGEKVCAYMKEDWDHEAEITEISYAYLDCGADGTPELALKYTIEIPMIDIWSSIFILQNRNEHLEICGDFDEWSRSGLTINENGVLYSAGSGGAAYHVFHKSFLDAQGDWHFLYECDSESPVTSVFYDNSPDGEIPEEINEDNLVLLDFYLEEYQYDEETYEDLRTKYQTFAILDEVGEETEFFYTTLDCDDSIYTDSAFGKYMKDAGLKVYKYSEIQDLIKQKEQKEGFDEAWDEAEPLEWITL